MQNINNIEKQRGHQSTTGSFEEIEATTDAGEACCVFPWGLCNDVPFQTVRRNASEEVGPGLQAARRLLTKASRQSVEAQSVDSQCD